MTDFIGDIHGYADKLEALLVKMGYTKRNGIYSHPDRKVLFVGDYIDRGKQIRETLEIVKAMVDSGNAIALLGNHEYNALCYRKKNENDEYLREHSKKNKRQHKATLEQFQNKEEEFNEYLEWFKSLPLYYETEKFRAVHACWDYANIDYLRKKLHNDRLTDELIVESVKLGSEFNDAIDQTLKGKELKMPDGRSFYDKDGAKREYIRIKWWENPAEMTYQSISVEKHDDLPDEAIDVNSTKLKDYYKEDGKAVFFGHYWLKDKPFLYKNNICCLDYSVANKGYLAAYRFDGETKLITENFIYV